MIVLHPSFSPFQLHPDWCLGSVLDQWKELHGKPKFIAVHESPNDDVMHPLRFGETNGFASQTFDPSSQGSVFALNPLSVLFAHFMLVFVE